jgi:hypothetical protein
LVWTPKKKKRLPRRANDLENQDASNLLELNSRIQFASNESKLVPRNLNLGPHLKSGP